ncbi:MAG: glycosyltransferase family 2 protein [Akkermansiaceae bacterium]|nr:glycosyltransferase family 2 protein [Armatimonadota bacterium]
MPPASVICSWIATTTGMLPGASVAYLLLLSGAAAYGARRLARSRRGAMDSQPVTTGVGRVTVIVPAHDEEPVIAGTVRSLQTQEFGAGCARVLVIADNCTDDTAVIAREHGAVVWERTNPAERGKGYALAWAVERLLAEPEPSDVFVIVDADTIAAPDFLHHLTRHLYDGRDAYGRCAVQGRYGVLNESEGWRAALMAGAFELVNHVRPLGLAALGLSVDLKGNGMGFTREVLQIAPWSGHSITEDLDYGLDLLANHGIVVGYAAEARVRAQMPTDANAAASQRDRWEKGRRLLVQERALPLLSAGITRRNLRVFEAGVRLLVPPLAELFALCVLWSIAVGIAVMFRLLPQQYLYAAVLLPLALVAYLLTGFHTAAASRGAFGALLYAPIYALWKFARYAASPLTSRSPEWVRTRRNAQKGTLPQ